MSFAVTFPQLLARFNETLFFSKEFRFFIDVVENMVNERKTSQQVSESNERLCVTMIIHEEIKII